MTGLARGDWVKWLPVKKFYYIIALTADQEKRAQIFFLQVNGFF